MKTEKLVGLFSDPNGSRCIPVKLGCKTSSTGEIHGFGLAWLSFERGTLYLSEEFNGRRDRRGRYTGDILKNIPGTWDEEILLDSEGILWCHSEGQPDVYCEIIPLTEMIP